VFLSQVSATWITRAQLCIRIRRSGTSVPICIALFTQIRTPSVSEARQHKTLSSVRDTGERSKLQTNGRVPDNKFIVYLNHHSQNFEPLQHES